MSYPPSGYRSPGGTSYQSSPSSYHNYHRYSASHYGPSQYNPAPYNGVPYSAPPRQETFGGSTVTPRSSSCALPQSEVTSTFHREPPASQPLPCKEEEPPAPPPYINKITLAKSSHQQFANFEVILLVFATPQAIEDFVTGRETSLLRSAGSVGASQQLWTALKPGQLVAVCLSGDEQAHARHLPVFGLIDSSINSLRTRLHHVVVKLADRPASAPQQCSVWQSGDYDVCCPGTTPQSPQHGFEELAHKCAEIGDEVVHQHLYKTEKSPLLHASEGRRMTLKERWSYATVIHGQAPPSECIATAKWTREPLDDTLLPSLSYEWTNQPQASEASSNRLYSKTGFYVDVSSGPHLVVINRHYPHWRAAGTSYLQLIPPKVILNRSTVESRKANGSLDRCRSVLRQLQGLKDQLKDAKKGLHTHQPLAQALLSHLSDFLLEQVTQARHPGLQATVTEVAKLSKEVMQTSEVCRYGSASESTTSDALERLLFASYLCLKSEFTLTNEELRLFATAMQAAMMPQSMGASFSDEVVGCFLISSRLALANAAPLCGKPVKQEADSFSFAVDEKPAVSREERAPASQASRRRSRDQQAGGEALQEQYSSDEYEGIFEDNTEVSFGDYSMADASAASSRKRPSEEGLSPDKAKLPRGSLAPKKASPYTEVDGKQLKKLLMHIMGKSDAADKAIKTVECANMFKASINDELPGAKQVSLEASKMCQTVQDVRISAEHRALLLMMAVENVCNLAEQDGDTANWDWVMLTLARHADAAVSSLADAAEKAHLATHAVQADPRPTTLRHELKASSCKFSGPLIDLLDKIREHLDTDLHWASSRGVGSQKNQVEIEADLIKAVGGVLGMNPTGGETGPLANGAEASTSSDSRGAGESLWKGPVPIVRIIFVNSAGNEGKKHKRAAWRYKECVFDALFQTYFGPLLRYLTARNLAGGYDGMDKFAPWNMQRRLLKFRLTVVSKLEENCNIGTAVFACRSCSDLVFASTRFLYFHKENTVVNPNKGYIFPPFAVKQGTSVVEAEEAADSIGWEVLFSALKTNKDDIIRLAKKKDPSQSMVTPTGTS